MKPLHCRGCGALVTESLVNLGSQPLSNAYLQREALSGCERTYPLHALVCANCFLVQLDVFESPEAIFSDYAYFSSFSNSWLDHCEAHVMHATQRLGLDKESLVVEVASNDGYLLQYFVKNGIRVLGIEPAANVAAVAVDNGVPTETTFFGAATAASIVARHARADMILANNVLAHVPDLHDFVQGIAVLLAPAGTATIEFPHLVPLLEENQFDTIYHEHFSYFSLLAIEPVLARHGLKVYDVDQLATHGGSLRLWVAHISAAFKESPHVAELRELERTRNLSDISTYRSFAARAQGVKNALLRFLIDTAERKERVIAYGAAAKGNTLLNYAGVRSDLVEFVVDRSPHKQGRYLPGSHLPILEVEKLIAARPDYVLILPWNIKDEIMNQMCVIRDWGGKFVTAIPALELR